MQHAGRTALVTGGYGFLGRAVGRKLNRHGYRVVGIGHGRWTSAEAHGHGFDKWLPAPVNVSSLASLDEGFDLVVHCAGSGSVGYSQMNPLQDFQKTVQSTADLLEYLRLNGSQALLIYPSSAGVYGMKDDRPIKESDEPNPISPYGYHKKIAEELLACYARNFGTRVAIIRFFSIYGPGLTKQLLWDASMKLSSAEHEVTFWGTGEETRDWIHLTDATELILKVADRADSFSVLNGATGARVTVSAVLHMLKEALGVEAKILFNGVTRPGDPRFYLADVSLLRQLMPEPTVSLTEGLKGYAEWFKAGRTHSL